MSLVEKILKDVFILCSLEDILDVCKRYAKKNSITLTISDSLNTLLDITFDNIHIILNRKNTPFFQIENNNEIAYKISNKEYICNSQILGDIIKHHQELIERLCIKSLTNIKH